MYLFILFTIPLSLFANKEDIRALYPQIWAELESIGYTYDKIEDWNTFVIEKKAEITYNASLTRKKVNGKN